MPTGGYLRRQSGRLAARSPRYCGGPRARSAADAVEVDWGDRDQLLGSWSADSLSASGCGALPSASWISVSASSCAIHVPARGCRKLCQGWSGDISVLVDEAAAVCRWDDSKLLPVGVWRLRRCQRNSVSGVTSHPARLGRGSAAAIAPSKLRSASVSSGRSTCPFERPKRTAKRANDTSNRYRMRHMASQDAAHHAWSAHRTIFWAPTGIFTGNCPCGFGLVRLVVLGRAARVRCVPAQQGEQSGMINPKSRRRSEKRLPSMSLEPQADLPPLPPPDELTTRTTKTLVWNADPDLEVYVVDRRTLNSQERLVDFALVVTAQALRNPGHLGADQQGARPPAPAMHRRYAVGAFC